MSWVIQDQHGWKIKDFGGFYDTFIEGDVVRVIVNLPGERGDKA